MSDVTMWMGPVANAQVAACFVPGSSMVPSFTCRNPFLAPIPTCQQMIGKFASSGRHLPAMLRSRGVDPAAAGKIYVGSFSAGHGALKDAILLSPEDRAMITAVYLADSTYTDWIGDDPKKGARPRAGYVSFMLDCLQSPKLFVATAGASTPKDSQGNNMPSSAQSMWALGAEVERVTGRKFADVELPWSVPAPVRAKVMEGAKGGAIYLIDYGSRVGHSQQATTIAPQGWNNIVLPWAGAPRCATPVAMLGLGEAQSCPYIPSTPPPEGLVPDPGEPGFYAQPSGAAAPPPPLAGWQLGPWGVGALLAGAVGGYVGLRRILSGRR